MPMVLECITVNFVSNITVLNIIFWKDHYWHCHSPNIHGNMGPVNFKSCDQNIRSRIYPVLKTRSLFKMLGARCKGAKGLTWYQRSSGFSILWAMKTNCCVTEKKRKVKVLVIPVPHSYLFRNPIDNGRSLIVYLWIILGHPHRIRNYRDYVQKIRTHIS